MHSPEQHTFYTYICSYAHTNIHTAYPPYNTEGLNQAISLNFSKAMNFSAKGYTRKGLEWDLLVANILVFRIKDLITPTETYSF